MNVRTLIEKLQDFPPEMPVHIVAVPIDDDGGDGDDGFVCALKPGFSGGDDGGGAIAYDEDVYL